MSQWVLHERLYRSGTDKNYAKFAELRIATANPESADCGETARGEPRIMEIGLGTLYKGSIFRHYKKIVMYI